MYAIMYLQYRVHDIFYSIYPIKYIYILHVHAHTYIHTDKHTIA